MSAPLTDKPLLLLDIDGVLAPFNMQVPPNGFELLRPPASPASFYFSAELGAEVAALEQLFELHWASTWEHHANRIISPLCGLGELPYVSFRFRLKYTGAPANELDWEALYKQLRAGATYDELRDHTAKLHNVAAVAGDRPAVWVDDILGADARLWADLRQAPTLLVHTEPSLGLTGEQIEQIRAFGREHRGS